MYFRKQQRHNYWLYSILNLGLSERLDRYDLLWKAFSSAIHLAWILLRDSIQSRMSNFDCKIYSTHIPIVCKIKFEILYPIDCNLSTVNTVQFPLLNILTGSTAFLVIPVSMSLPLASSIPFWRQEWMGPLEASVLLKKNRDDSYEGHSLRRALINLQPCGYSCDWDTDASCLIYGKSAGALVVLYHF